MPTEPTTIHAVPAAGDAAGDIPGIKTRLFSITALLAVAGVAVYALLTIVRVFTDSWVAPINLSPDNDKIIQLNLQLTRQVAEMERVAAEVEKIDNQIVGIDAGLEKIQRLHENTQNLMQWGARSSRYELDLTNKTVGLIRDQQATLNELYDQRLAEVERARSNAAANLITRTQLEQQEAQLEQLGMQRKQMEKALLETEGHQRKMSVNTGAYAAAARKSRNLAAVRANMPDIVRRQEQMIRLELEEVQLMSEKRGLLAMKETAERNLGRLRKVLDQIKGRPLYRAIRTDTNVAFIPYDQLEGVSVGATVLKCSFAVFNCQPAGRIKKLIPGEVVTQDPWGEMARGRYAMLDLTDPIAVQEKILRVRD